MQTTTRLVLALAAASALGLVSVQAYAAGGGGSFPRTDIPRPAPSPSNKKEQARESDYDKAEYMIKGEKFEEAIPLLQKVVADNPRDADAWNYLGFASRKLGKNEDALGYYNKALAIDPKHKGAHNYLGELYLQMNDLPKAEAELATLKGICASNCEEAEDLTDSIADYKQKHQARS
jgi:tetratricopeptide (TPR) repeat protein